MLVKKGTAPFFLSLQGADWLCHCEEHRDVAIPYEKELSLRVKRGNLIQLNVLILTQPPQ